MVYLVSEVSVFWRLDKTKRNMKRFFEFTIKVSLLLRPRNCHQTSFIVGCPRGKTGIDIIPGHVFDMGGSSNNRFTTSKT